MGGDADADAEGGGSGFAIGSAAIAELAVEGSGALVGALAIEVCAGGVGAVERQNTTAVIAIPTTNATAPMRAIDDVFRTGVGIRSSSGVSDDRVDVIAVSGRARAPRARVGADGVARATSEDSMGPPPLRFALGPEAAVAFSSLAGEIARDENDRFSTGGNTTSTTGESPPAIRSGRSKAST